MGGGVHGAFAWPLGEPILQAEARAAMAGVQRVWARAGMGVGVCERRLMGLVDSQWVVAAFTKGRCRNSVVNSLIAKWAAGSLATGSTLDLVWVPSAHMPADKASRRQWARP